MKPLGTIQLLGVQRSPLKNMEGERKVYRADNLVFVDRIRLTGRGVFGLLEDGSEIIDAHHFDHPLRGGKPSKRSLSIGFTAHYARMRSQFGGHLFDGCAGENIIVHSQEAFSLEQLAGTLVVLRGPAQREIVRLRVTEWLEPCVPFSHYVHQAETDLPAEVLKETLQFLRNGRRGFLVELIEPIARDEEIVLKTGDEIFLE